MFNRIFFMLEQLEVCAELISSDSTGKQCMALNTLDSIIDASSYNFFENNFKLFSSIFVLRKKGGKTNKEKQKILAHFKEKIVELHKSKKIKREDSEIVSHLHKTRNIIHHRGDFVTHCLREKCIVLFEIASTFVSEILDKGGLWGRVGYSINKTEDKKWFRKYGITDFFDTERDLPKIFFLMNKSIHVSDMNINKSLKNNLSARIKELHSLIKAVPKSFTSDWNMRIKVKEFEFNKKQELESLKEVYAYDNDEEYWKKIEEYHKEEYNLFLKFKQTISLKTLATVERKISRFGKQHSSSALLKYLEIEDRLLRLEYCINEIYFDYDRYVQEQIDIARGK